MKKIFLNLLALPYRLFFSKISVFSLIFDSKIHKESVVSMGCRVYSSRIDRYTFIGKNTFLNQTLIGSFTSISNNCYIGSFSHPIDWVSTSPLFHNGKNIFGKNFANHMFVPSMDTIIGNDVWIGEGCKIKSGVKIGDGAIIGMGSVVTKNIEPYSIYAGCPAKKIRCRFDEKTIELLKKIRWWEWSENKIIQNAKNFNDVKKLLKCRW